MPFIIVVNENPFFSELYPTDKSSMWCIQLSDSHLLMVQSTNRLSAPDCLRVACDIHVAKIKRSEHIELVLSERYPLMRRPLAGAFTSDYKAQLRSFVVLIMWLFELMLSRRLSLRHYNSLGECAPSSFAIEYLPACFFSGFAGLSQTLTNSGIHITAVRIRVQ